MGKIVFNLDKGKKSKTKLSFSQCLALKNQRRHLHWLKLKKKTFFGNKIVADFTVTVNIV